MELRDVSKDDFAAIVDLNAVEERQTSAMDWQRLGELHALASYHKVAVIDGQAVGFLLAMRETAPYELSLIHI